MEDYYNWKAQYFDGTIVPQIKSDGTPTKFTELDFEKIKYWVLEPLYKDYKRIVLTLDGKKRPIYWRQNIGVAIGVPFSTIFYKFGWQDTIDGKNIKVINLVYPNGDIEQLIDTDDSLLQQPFLDQLYQYMLTQKNLSEKQWLPD